MNRWLKQTVMAATVVASVGATAPASAADVFIKITDIKGESNDAKHKGEIDALSWSWGTSQARATAAGGGAVAGRPVPQDLVIAKAIDSSSPQFVQFAATGRRLKEVLLTVRLPGKGGGDFIRIKLTDVLVSSVKLSGAAGQERPMEEVALAFAGIEYTVIPLLASGAAGAAVTTTVNYATNK